MIDDVVMWFWRHACVLTLSRARQQINQQVVKVASQKIYPPVFLTSDTVSVKGNQIVVIGIEEGISKPYKDLNGTI